jgi:hypothetical protein
MRFEVRGSRFEVGRMARGQESVAGKSKCGGLSVPRYFTPASELAGDPDCALRSR